MLRLLSIVQLLRSKEHGPEVKAAVVVAALGGLLIFLMAGAFADGEARRREMPLRAVLGSANYDALAAGTETPQHYLHRPPIPAWVRPFTDVGEDPSGDRLAPDFELRTRDGSTWRLRDHRGKVVVLNFWTVTCGPCVEEMPSVIELAQTMHERGDRVEVATVSVDRDWDTVRTVVADDAPLTVLLDADRSVVRGKFGTRLFPETWIIDRDGVIRLRVDGSREWSSPLLIDVIESYL